MDFKDISLPEIYKESQDFRFFVDWFVESLTKIEYDTTNFFDLYDPLRCPKHLLWALADTMGYKYDDRLPASFNRLVLLNFMSMIRNKGSKNGITLAAETNLGQFDIYMQAQGYVDESDIIHEGNEELYDRLENTSVPVNSVYVTPHTEAGYIDIVYFSTKKPKDACIEYVRPLGMYCFQHSGVKFDSRTKISVDARLTNDRDAGTMDYGPTQVGHYSREDYARLQKAKANVIPPDILNISNWNKNINFPIDNKYDSDTSENILSYTTITGYERFYNKINLTPNTDYIVSFDFCSPSGVKNGYYGGLGAAFFVSPGIDSELSKINNSARGYLNYVNTIANSGVLGSKDPESSYTHYELTFNSSNYSAAYLVLDFGFVLDHTDTTFKFKNLSLKVKSNTFHINDTAHTRREVWKSNIDNEGRVNPQSREEYNPGYRALYSLQLCNNEQVVKALIDPIFSLGYGGPQDVETYYVDDYLKYPYEDHYSDGTIIKNKAWNLRYNKAQEESITKDVYTFDDSRTEERPAPVVNPVMTQLGDAISMSDLNTEYTKVEDDGTIVVKNSDEV